MNLRNLDLHVIFSEEKSKNEAGYPVTTLREILSVGINIIKKSGSHIINPYGISQESYYEAYMDGKGWVEKVGKQVSYTKDGMTIMSGMLIRYGEAYLKIKDITLYKVGRPHFVLACEFVDGDVYAD